MLLGVFLLFFEDKDCWKNKKYTLRDAFLQNNKSANVSLFLCCETISDNPVVAAIGGYGTDAEERAAV